MRIGIGIAQAGDIAAAARAAEASGFDYVHCGEHLFFHGPTPHALTSLAVAAGATERIRLLSAVTLAPLYPAAVLAKLAATLDIASGGRLDLGLGIGGEYPPEFAAAGVPVAERGPRTDEALEVLSALFSGDRVTFAGRWAQIDGLRLRPVPAQPGGPPIWLAGRKGAALRRAGAHANVWMPYMVTPEMFADGLARVRSAAGEIGREPASVTGSLYGFLSVDSDGARARRWAAELVSRIYRQDASRFAPYLIAGTPSRCVERLREFEQAGAASAQLNLACPPESASAMQATLAADVLPDLAPAESRFPAAESELT